MFFFYQFVVYDSIQRYALSEEEDLDNSILARLKRALSDESLDVLLWILDVSPPPCSVLNLDQISIDYTSPSCDGYTKLSTILLISLCVCDPVQIMWDSWVASKSSDVDYLNRSVLQIKFTIQVLFNHVSLAHSWRQSVLRKADTFIKTNMTFVIHDLLICWLDYWKSHDTTAKILLTAD